MFEYKEAIEEFGQGVAAALLEEEYNQFISSIGPAAASFYPWEDNDNYIDYIETIGHRKVRANHEELYRMAEGI